MTLHKLTIAATSIVALLATSCTSKSGNTSDRENDNMKGKVKMVTERHFMAIQDFNSAKKGDPFSPEDGEYDSRWTYNENGYMTSYTKLQVGEEDTIWTTSMVYDSVKTNLKTLEITDGEDGIVCRYQVIKYNKDDKPEEIATTDGRGQLQSKSTISYDKNKETQNYYTPDGKLYMCEVTTMDDNMPKKIEKFDAEGKRQQVIVNYWDDKRRDSVIFYNGEGQIMTQVGFDYDDKGNLINQHGRDEKGEALRIETWEYVYDQQGNWVRQTYRLDGKPYYIVERQIEYYK